MGPVRTYRLFLSDGAVLETFEAGDDTTAERYGRLIDRREGSGWRPIVTWGSTP